MQYIKLVVVAVALVYLAAGCGKTTTPVSVACTLTPVPDGTQISCPGSASQVVYNGDVGPQGAPGLQGATGPQGEAGAAGAAATPCTVSQVTGGVAIACNGVSQTVLNGTNGVNGTDATPVTTVQFCPNLGATTYASNWPEQGLCIQNNLYGVYWTGTEAFLSELPPGAYTSTSPNGCNFTVASGCQITED